MSNKTTKFSLRKTSIGLLSLAAIAVAGTATVSAAEVEVANVTAHGTGVTADPISTFNLNTGELTAKGSSVLNSDYKPALDPSTVDIHVSGEGATAEALPEVKLAFDNGEPYVYATGTGVTASAELPALDPSTVDIHVNGEGVTAPALDEVKFGLDENGLYFTNVPTEAPTAEALPEVTVGGKDGDYYLYAKGESVTAPELPVAELPELVTAKGESVTAPAFPVAELPELVTAKGDSVTAPALPTVDPASLKVTPEANKAPVAKAPVAASTAATKATLPVTGQTDSAAFTISALGLLGAAVLVAKRKKSVN